ncbi:hypothetical protein TFLX_04067 [Thermoflexales bacterium]|nr:hypothetical protein TFLX_04067 [Thermoflexales bacterium]
MANFTRHEFIQRHLACPACHMLVTRTDNGYQCPNCGTAFEIKEDIPVMVMPLQRKSLKGLEQKKAVFKSRTLQNKIRQMWVPPSPSLNVAGGAGRVIQAMPQGAAILEVGSGIRRLREDVINLEVDLFANVDIVATGDEIPFPDSTFDLVISQAVLEHVQEPQLVVVDMLRVLKPGGQIYVEIPFLQGYHADPNDYQRYTLRGIEHLLRAADKIDSGVAVGPSSALVWIIREYVPLWFPQFLRAPVRLLTAWITTPFKYLDWLIARRPDAHRIASGLYYWGRKPVAP